MDNRSLLHTKWKCQYHIVFIPKCWKKVLYGKVREDVREILSTLCKYKNVEIIAVEVCVDHVHLSIAIPPKLSVSEKIQEVPLYSVPVKMLAAPAFGESGNIVLWMAYNKPPVELVVADLDLQNVS